MFDRWDLADIAFFYLRLRLIAIMTGVFLLGMGIGYLLIKAL